MTNPRKVYNESAEISPEAVDKAVQVVREWKETHPEAAKHIHMLSTPPTNPIDLWIATIPEDPKSPCPCGCGRKWKRISKGGETAIEEHAENFMDKLNQTEPEED